MSTTAPSNDETREGSYEPLEIGLETLDGGTNTRSPEANTSSAQQTPGVKNIPLAAALAMAVFCVALDNTILATAIPKITDDFHAIGDTGWYASAYLLTNCTFQLVFGKLYSLFPTKRTFLTALGIFKIGSIVCGAAPDATGLIVGRAVAGIGAGGLFSGSLIIVALAVPLESRPVYIGCISSMFGLASIIGPILDGTFADEVTWRLCFYINLPVSASLIAFTRHG